MVVNITNDGGAAIIMRGICWSTSSTPTIADSKSYNDTGSGQFTSQMTGLIAETKYYVRAYATNSVGTSYADEKSFTTNASLTGKWINTFSFSSGTTIFNSTINLIQHDDNKITGDFVLSDGSGYSQLLSSSLIANNSVIIDVLVTGTSVAMSFQGTVNSSFDSMSGIFSGSGITMGTWRATKTSSKSAIIKDKESVSSEKERLLELLKN